MFHVFDGPNADSVWQEMAEAYRAGRFVENQQSRAGVTSELLHVSICIRDPRQRWVVSRRPALNLAFALAETIWILRGRNDSAVLNYFNRQLPKYAGTGPTYHGAYGKRLRQAFGFDQIDRAYSVLKNNADSRQAVLQIWNPPSDFPDPSGQPVASDIPCNLTSMLKVRQGRLEWLQILRSNDLYRGLPYNLVQFTTLQEVIAGWLGLDVGEYQQISDSLHVYDDTASCVKGSPRIAIEESRDNLALRKEESDAAFATLELLLDQIVSESVDYKQIESLCSSKTLPQPFQNIARVLSAEGFRRRGDLENATRLIADCSNALFRQLYSSWLARVADPATLPLT